MSLEVNKRRADFPALTQRVRGKKLVYLDSAATALKPWAVIERVGQFYTYETANVHRGAHFLADQATGYFEETRLKLKKFLNADSTEEIIFTSGTTGSINLIAQSYGRKFLKEGDEILLSEMEHHANIVPWQMLAEEKKLSIKIIPVTDAGDLDLSQLDQILTSKTRLVAVTHVSNTLGTINDIRLLAEKAHSVGAVIAVDGAQAVSNFAVDVKALNVDFYSFSAHKIYGPYGIGVLFGKRELLEKMPPWIGGGSMISQVTFPKTTYNDLPFKFEAGTPHIEGVLALGSAIDYVTKIGFDEIVEHEISLREYATQELQKISGLKIIGTSSQKVAILSFVVESLHHSDLSQVLDQEGIAVRAGHHCTQPLMSRFGVTGTVRASFAIFNDKMDVDALVKGIHKAKELFA